MRRSVILGGLVLAVALALTLGQAARADFASGVSGISSAAGGTIVRNGNQFEIYLDDTHLNDTTEAISVFLNNGGDQVAMNGNTLYPSGHQFAGLSVTAGYTI